VEKRSFPIRKKENRWKAHLLDADDKTLENARLLEENQRLRQLVEHRNAELAVIQRLQEGLASKLDMQAIYDLVGDKIREIFHNTDVEIRIYDPRTNLLHFPYFIDNGKSITVDPIPLTDSGISSYILRTGRTLVLNENLWQEAAKFGSIPILSKEGHLAKSGVFVPLVVNRQARGLLVLGDVEREHAFSESDVRLLETLANSMSTALENARLFDETQRLLKETEERNAELALINSVQSALAARLDIQGIYDAVGDRLREIFDRADVGITIYDEKTNLIHIPYDYESGQRVMVDSFALREQGFLAHVLRTREPLFINENMAQEMEKYGSPGVIAGTVMDKSLVHVPLIAGDRARGVISIKDSQHEHAFNDSDVRLLTTIANSMSAALENARLFDETQRLLKETEQRNAELAIINSVQQGLAAELDFQALVDMVGDKLRQVFGNSDVTIGIYDPKTDFGSVPYIVENGQRLHIEPFKIEGKGFTGELIRNPQTILINQNMAQEMEKFGSRVLPGTSLAKSMLDVPLVVGGVLRGKLQLQDMNKEHAFTDSDVRLLEMIASSMSVALENARLFDEVQKKNAEITDALERETASNDILRVIAASPTDIKPVLEVIARNAAQLSGAHDAIITLRAGDILRVDAHYGDIPTFPIGEGFPFNRYSVAGRAILEGRPLQAIHNQEGVKSEYPEGDKAARKYGYRMSCAVPLMREGKAIGAISIRRLKPELLTEKQIALIQPFANQAAIAVENVRLFNETTRLLKETEQRNAELAIINSVQAGLASKLDIQAIYDLVGDKLSEIFDAPAVFISNYDLVANQAYYPYYSIERKRISLEPRSPSGAALEIIRTRQPVFLQHDAEKRLVEEYKMPTIPGTPNAESYLLMPMIVGSQVKGGIGVMSTDHQHPLGDSSVRLLQTIASSMSVALENARLFDETQRLFLEAKEARAAAEQASQAKSAFLSSMSHELRTPLNAIINFVEMVARGMIGPVNQEQIELLDQALESSKHLLNLINDVLDISKIQAGQLTLYIEDQVSVQVELEATLSIVGGLLQEKGLQLIRDIDPHLPMISCDRRRVRQVLLNLISNAVKFTNEGTVTVSVKNQGQAILFAVIDTGPGIPLKKQNLIFEPFLQAENSERQVQGTGLGLPISRSLVRAHGGELWVDSQHGEGSAFFFSLPVVRRSTL
jgi:signal transduction histidine kinase/nitrate/nitrite-specific signal transduction histidine kinase